MSSWILTPQTLQKSMQPLVSKSVIAPWARALCTNIIIHNCYNLHPVPFYHLLYTPAFAAKPSLFFTKRLHAYSFWDQAAEKSKKKGTRPPTPPVLAMKSMGIQSLKLNRRFHCIYANSIKTGAMSTRAFQGKKRLPSVKYRIVLREEKEKGLSKMMNWVINS